MSDKEGSEESALVMDDMAFTKLSAAERHLKDIQEAIDKVGRIQWALDSNNSLDIYEQRHDLVVKVVLAMPPYVLTNVMGMIQAELESMMRGAEAKLEKL